MTRTALAVVVVVASVAAACSGPMASTTAKAPDPLAGVPADQLFAQGVEYKNAGDLIRAEQYLVAAVERGYPQKDALELLLEVCVGGSRYQAGLAHAERHLARHPEDWALRYFAASLHVAIGDAHTARIELERVIGDRPQLAAAHFDLGVIYRDELGDHAAAEAAFRRYLELAPSGDKAVAAQTWLGWRERETAAPRRQTPVPDATSAADVPSRPVKIEAPR